MAIIVTDSAWGSGSWGDSNLSNASWYGKYTAGLDASSGNMYLFTKPNNDKGCTLSLYSYDGNAGPTSVNANQTLDWRDNSGGGASWSQNAWVWWYSQGFPWVNATNFGSHAIRIDNNYQTSQSIPANTTVKSLTYTANASTAHTLSGSTLTVSEGITNSSTVNHTISAPIAFGSGTRHVRTKNTATGNNLTFSGNLTGSATVHKWSDATTSSQRGGVLKLTGESSSFTGTIQIGTGVVAIARSGNWGNSSGKICVGPGRAGVRLELSGGVTVKANVDLNNSSTNHALVNVSGNNAVSGTVTAGRNNAVITNTAGSLTLGMLNVVSNMILTGSGNTTVNTYTNSGTKGQYFTKEGTGTLQILNSAGGAARRGLELKGGTLSLTSAGVVTNLAITNLTAGTIIDVNGAVGIGVMNIQASTTIKLDVGTTGQNVCESLTTRNSGGWAISSDFNVKLTPGSSFNSSSSATWTILATQGTFNSTDLGHVKLDTTAFSGVASSCFTKALGSSDKSIVVTYRPADVPQSTAVSVTQLTHTYAGSAITLVGTGGNGTGTAVYTFGTTLKTGTTGTGSLTSAGVLTVTAAGTFVFDVTRAASTGYTARTDEVTVTVGPGAQEISGLTTPINKTYGDANFTLGATGVATVGGATVTAAGSVTYVSSDEDVATIDGRTVHIVGAGTCTITASAGSTALYAAAADATATLNVAKKNPTVSASVSSASIRVGGTTTLTGSTDSGATLTFGTSDSGIASLSGSGATTRTVRGEAYGTATLTVNSPATANYNAGSATCTISVKLNAPTTQPAIEAVSIQAAQFGVKTTGKGDAGAVLTLVKAGSAPTTPTDGTPWGSVANNNSLALSSASAYPSGATDGTKVIINSTGASFPVTKTITGASANTHYYVTAYGFNHSGNLSGSNGSYAFLTPGTTIDFWTLAAEPSAAPTIGTIVAGGHGASIPVTAGTGGDGVLVLVKTGSSTTVTPVDGTTYAAGDTLSGWTVAYSGPSGTAAASGLTSLATYQVKAFSYSLNGGGVPNYYTTAFASTSFETTDASGPTTWATGVDGTSYLLNWSPVASDSAGYDVQTAASATTVTETFDSDSVWPNESAYPTAARNITSAGHVYTFSNTLGASSANTCPRNNQDTTYDGEIRFSAVGSCLYTEAIYGEVTSVTTKMRAGGSGNNAKRHLDFSVSYDGGESWTKLDTYEPASQTAFSTFTYSTSPLKGGEKGVRLRWAKPDNNEYLTMLSEISYTYTPGAGGIKGYAKSVTGLTSGNTYHAQVRKSPDGDWSDDLAVKAGVLPSGLTATATRNSVTFTWTGVNSPVGYGVQATKTAAPSSWGPSTPGTTSLALGSFGSKQWKYTGESVTTTSGTLATAPGALSEGSHVPGKAGNALVSTNFPIAGMTSVKIGFTLGGFNLDTVERSRVNVYFQLDDGPWSYLGTAVTPSTSGTAPVEWTVPQGVLEEGETIAFKIEAVNAAPYGTSYFMSPKIASLQVTRMSKGSGDYSGTTASGSWVGYKTVDTTTGATSYTVNVGGSGTSVYFRVQALQGSLASPTAKSVWVEASGTTTAYTAPGTPVLSAVTRNSMTATWTAGDTTDLDHYVVQWSTSSTFATTAGSANVAAGTLTKAISGLTASTKYYVRVRAVGTDGQQSAWSGVANATTSAFPGPELLAADPVARYGFTANWTADAAATGGYQIEWTRCGGGAADTTVSTCNNGTLTVGGDSGWRYIRPAGSGYPKWAAGSANQTVGHNMIVGVSPANPSPAVASPDMDFSGFAGGYVEFSHWSRHATLIAPDAQVTLWYRTSTDGSTWGSWTEGATTANLTSGATIVTEQLPIPAGAAGQAHVQIKLSTEHSLPSGSGHASIVVDGDSTYTGPMIKDIVVHGTSSGTPDYDTCAEGRSGIVNVAAGTTLKAFTGLAAGTPYYYHVRSVVSGSPATYSAWSEGQVTTLAPMGPPEEVWAEDIRQKHMTVAWSEADGADSATLYKYQVSGCSPSATPTVTAVAESPTNTELTVDADWSYIGGGTLVGAETVTVGGSTLNKASEEAYVESAKESYPVWAGNKGGNHPEHSLVLAGLNSPGLESAEFSTVGASAGSLSFGHGRWYAQESGSGAATVLTLYYSVDGGDSWTQFATAGNVYNQSYAYNNVVTHNLPDAAMGHAHVKVRLVAEAATVGKATTDATTYHALGAAVTAAKVTLTKPTGNYTGSGCVVASGEGLTHDQLSAELSGLSANSTYYFRVAASDGVLVNGAPQYGAWVESMAKTLAAPVAPASAWVVPESIGRHAMTVQWEAASGAETYEVKVYQGSSASGTLKQTLTTDATTLTVTGLDAQTQYYFTVRAKADGEQSSGTANCTGTTSASLAVTGFCVTNILDTSLTVKWDAVAATAYTLEVGPMTAEGTGEPLCETIACPATTLARSDAGNGWFYLGGNANYPKYYVKSSGTAAQKAEDQGHVLSYSSAGTPGIQSRWFSTFGAKSATVEFLHGRWFNDGNNSALQVFYSIDGGTTWASAGDIPATGNAVPGGTSGGEKTVTRLALPARALGQRTVAIRVMAPKATSGGSYGYGAEIKDLTVKIEAYPQSASTFSGAVSGGSKALTGLTAGTRYWFRLTATETGVAESATAIQAAATRTKTKGVVQSQGFEGTSANGALDTTGWEYSIKYIPVQNGSAAAHTTRASGDPEVVVVDGENPLYGDRALRMSGSAAASVYGVVEFADKNFGSAQNVAVTIPFAVRDLASGENLWVCYSTDNGSTWSAPAGLETLVKSGMTLGKIARGGSDTINQNWPYNHGVNETTRPGGDAYTFEVRGASRIAVRVAFCGNAGGAKHYCYVDEVKLERLATPPSAVSATANAQGSVNLGWTPAGGQSVVIIRGQDQRNPPASVDLGSLPHGYEVVTNATGGTYWVNTADPASATTGVDSQVTGGWKYFYYFYGALANGDGTYTLSKECVSAEAIVKGMVEAIASQGWDGWDVHPWGYKKGRTTNPGQAGDCGYWAYNQSGATLPYKWAHFEEDSWEYDGDARGNQGAHDYAYYYGAGKTYGPAGRTDPDSTQQLGVSSYTNYFGTNCFRLSGGSGWIWSGTHTYTNNNNNVRTVTNPYINTNNAAIQFDTVDLSGYKNVQFSFHYAQTYSGGGNYMHVAISTNGNGENGSWLAYDNKNAAGWRQVDSSRDYGLQLQTMTEEQTGGNVDFYDESRAPYGNPFVLNVPDSVTQMTVRLTFFDTTGHDQRNALVFVDEVRLTGEVAIEAPKPYISEIGKDRFMVHWAPVTDATSYDVQVTEVCDESVIKLAQAFPVNALPKDWTKSDTGVNFPKTASRLYSGATGDHDHGLSLTGQGGWLTSPEVGGSTNLHFWAKANNGSGSSKLIVQAKGADEPESAWETLLTKTCAQLTATWTEYELALPNRQWTQVRFMRSTDGTGDIYVDDVEFHGEGVYTGTLKLNATGVSATNQVVTGLESGHRYLAHVRAVGAPAGVVVRSAWGETADWTSGDFKVVPDGFEMTRSTWAAASGGMVVIAVDKGTAPSAVKAPEGSKTAASFTPGAAYTDNGSTGAHVMWAGTAGQSSPGREYVSPYDGEHPAQDFVVYWKRGNYWEGRLETNVVLGTYICSAADALAYTNGVAVAGSAAVDSDTAYAGGKGWTGPWKLSVRHGESWNNAIIDKNSSGAEGLIETNQIQGAGGNMIKLMPGGSANSKQVALKRQLAADLSAGSDWWGMFTMKVTHPHDHSWAGIRLLGAGSAEQASVGNVWNNNSSSQSAAGISDTASSYEISAGGTYIYVFKWDAGQKKMYLHVQYVSGTSSPVWDPSVAATLTLPNSWTWDVNGKSITGMTDIRYIELVAQNNNGSDEYVGDVWFDEIRIGESWADIIGKETEAPFPVTSATAWTDGNELVRVSWTYADAGHDSTANVDRPLADGVRLYAREGTSGEWTEIYQGKGTNEAAVAAGGISRWDHVVAPGSTHQYQVVAYASAKTAPAVNAVLKDSAPASYSVTTGLYGAEEYVNPFAYTNWAVASSASGMRWLGGNGFGDNYWSVPDGSAGTWSIATPEEAQAAAHITNAVTGSRLAAGNVLKVVVDNGETASIDRTLGGDAWCGQAGQTFYVAFRMAYQWGDAGGRQVGLRLTDSSGSYVQFGKARGDDSGYQHRFGVTASPYGGSGYSSGWSTAGDDMTAYGNSGVSRAYLVVGKVNWSASGKANLRAVKYVIGNDGSLATLPSEEKDVTWEASYDNAAIQAIRKIELIAGAENSGYGTIGTAWFDEIRFGTSWEDIVGATEPEDAWVDGISATAYLGDTTRWYMYGWPKGPKQSAWVSLATSTSFTTVLATNDTDFVDNADDRGKQRTKWQGKEIQFTQTGTLYGGGSVKGELVTVNSWTRTAANDHKWNTYTVNPLPAPTSPSATTGTAKLTLRWTQAVVNPGESNERTFEEVMVVRYTGGTVPEPVQGTTYLKGQSIGAGTVVYRGTATSLEDKGLTKNTTYNYAFFTVNNSYYSPAATASGTTDPNDPPIVIDGDPIEWVGVPSEVKNSSTVSSGEWIWTDKVLDGRVDKPAAYDADITEFRMKVDGNGYVNFMARLHCLTNKQNPYISVGIVTNVDATQLAAEGNTDGEDWIGDESATFMGGNLFSPADLHYADIQMAVHWVTTAAEGGLPGGSGAWVVELYRKDGTSWYAPTTWEAASSANGAEDPCIEWKVKRSDLGLDYASVTPARFTVASFANAGGWNNDTEATVDLSSGKSHAVDALCIAPWGVNDKDLALSAWDEGIQKGNAEYWFDIWFGPTSLHNAAPNAPASYELDGNPAVDGQLVTASPTMRWSACTDGPSDDSSYRGFVVGYLVEVSTNEYFNGLEGTTENGPISCRVNVKSVDGEAMMSYRYKTDSRYYWWRVRARDNSGALSAPTPWHYEVTGKTDNEGPEARLLFVGKNEEVALYVADTAEGRAFRHEADMSGDGKYVLDSDLEDGGHTFGFVIEWYDVNGVFATNWYREAKGDGDQWPKGTGKNPYNPSAYYDPSVGDFAWSIQSHHGDGTPYGRVSPNWDLIIVDRSTVSHEAPAERPAQPAAELVGSVSRDYTWTNAMVLPTDDGGTETIWGWIIDCGLDHVFQPDETINTGNDGQYITNHVQGAFSIGTYRTDLDIYLTVSAEDGCRSGPYAETADYDWPLTAENGSTGSWQANNSPSWQVSGWCAAAPNPSRNVTTNQLLHIHVRDNDTEPPVASQAKWRAAAQNASGTPLLPMMAVTVGGDANAPGSWDPTWANLGTQGRVPTRDGQGKGLEWQLTDGDVSTYAHPSTAGGTGSQAWKGSAAPIRLFFNVYDEYLHSGLASFTGYSARPTASQPAASPTKTDGAAVTGSYTSKANNTRTLYNTLLMLGSDTNSAGYKPAWSKITQYPWEDSGANTHGWGTGPDTVLAWQLDASEYNVTNLLGTRNILSALGTGLDGDGAAVAFTNDVKLLAWDNDNNADGDQEGAELAFGRLLFSDDDATPPEMAYFTSLGTGTNYTWFGRLGEWHFGESSAAPVFTTNSRMPAIQLSQEVTLHQYNTSGDPTRHWNQDSHVIYYNGGGGPSDDWNQTGAPYFEFTLHGSNGITWSADMIGFENRIAQAGPTQYALTVQAPTLSLVNNAVQNNAVNEDGHWSGIGTEVRSSGGYAGMVLFTGGSPGQLLSPELPVAEYTTFVVSGRAVAYGSAGASGSRPDRTLKIQYKATGDGDWNDLAVQYKATGDSDWANLPNRTFVARNFAGTGDSNGQDFRCELNDAVPGLLGSAKSVQIRVVANDVNGSYTFGVKDFKLTYGSGDGREHLLGRMEIEKEMDEGGANFKSETVTSVIFAFDTPIQCKKDDNHIFRLYAFDATRYNAAGEFERLVDVLPADRWTFTWGIRELFIHGTVSEPKKSEVTDYDVAEGAWTNRLEALDGAMAGYDTVRSGLRVFDAVDGSGNRTEYSGEAPSFRILYPQAYSTSPKGVASGGELILRSVSAATFNHLDDPEFDTGTPWTLSPSGAAVSGGKLVLTAAASAYAKQTVTLDAMAGVKSATVSGTVRAKGTVGGVNKLTVTAAVKSKANVLLTTLTQDIVTTSRAKNYAVGPWALDYDNVGSVEFTVGQTDATATELTVDSLAGYVAQWGADITEADGAWATTVTNGMEAAKVLVRTPELDLTHTAMPLSSNLTADTAAKKMYTLEATLHDYDLDRAGDALATTATTNFWLWDDDDVAPQWGEKFVSPMGIFVNGKIVSLKARRESGVNHIWPILDADLTALAPSAEVLFSLSAYDYSGWKTTSFTIGTETIQSGDAVASAAATAGWTQSAAAGAADSPAATNTWSIGAKNLYTAYRDAFVTGGQAGQTLEMKAAAIDLDNDRLDDARTKDLSRVGYVWFADQDVSAPGWGAQSSPYQMLMISAGVGASAGLSDLLGTDESPVPYALGGAANNTGEFAGRTYTVYDGQMKEYGAAGANQFVVTANLNDPLPTGDGARARHPTGLQRGSTLTETRAMWGDSSDPGNVFTVTNTHLVLATAGTGEGSLTNVAYSTEFTDPAIGKTRINTQAGHTSWTWTFTTNDIGSLLPAGETSASLTLTVHAYDADANRHEDQMHAELAGPTVTLRDDDTSAPGTPAIDFSASTGVSAGSATRETANWAKNAEYFQLVFTKAADGALASGDTVVSGIKSHRMASEWTGGSTGMATKGTILPTPDDGETDKVRAPLSGIEQGLVKNYLYAVDSDDDRPGDALASATPSEFYTAYDCTPPTKIGYDYLEGHRVKADTELVDDPTSQFDVSWPVRTHDAAGREVDVGGDDTGDGRYPAGKTGTDVLSPWSSYRVYYGTYNPLDVPADDDVNSKVKCFVYTNFIQTGAYQAWPYVCATNRAADPLATSTNYEGLATAGTTAVRLFDLDFDEDYVIIVTGVDKAGNEGPADLYSWATNNTIRFALTQGVMRARSAVTNAFPNHNMRPGDHYSAALYWKAAGPADEHGGVRVTKEYDLIYRDGANFDENSELEWTKVATVQSNWFTDASGFGNSRGRMRFYRASYKDRWQTAVTNDQGVVRRQRPLVSEEVYTMDNVVLSEGVNNVSLQGVPYTNTFAGVFGTDLAVWPAGTTADESVQVRFYSQSGSSTGAKVAMTEGYFLASNGKWYADGGVREVTDVEQSEGFFRRPFAIVLPQPLPTEYATTNAVDRDKTNAPLKAMVWHPIMQVPTNGVFRSTVLSGAGGSGNRYNPVALNLPVTVGPGGLELPMAGTRKVVETVSDPWTEISLLEANEKYPGAVHNLGDTIVEPGFVPGKTSGDRLYVLDTETKAARSGSTVYCTTNGVWKFVTSDAEVPGNFIKPNDMIVIISRNPGTGTNTTWTWSYDPTNYYRLPTRHMGTESSN